MPSAAQTVAATSRSTRPAAPHGAMLDDLVARHVWHVRLDCPTQAARVRRVLKQAGVRQITDDGGADLLLTDKMNRDDDGAVLFVAEPDVGEAVERLRSGAIDYLGWDVDDAALRRRLREAVGRRWLAVRTDRRLARLKIAVRRLNVARRNVSRKVDLLCNDFVDAYDQVAEQVQIVRRERHLRELLDGAEDLEQLLCHAMDWLLRQLGHCNIAIFLADDAGGNELGAYMKHTIAGEASLTDWLRDHVVDETHRRGGKLIAAPEVFASQVDPLCPLQVMMLDQHVIAAESQYLAEPLGTLIAFRDDAKPFTADEQATLHLVADAFATALTALVHQSDDKGDESNDDDTDDHDAGDWWKRGAAAPF